MELKNFHVRYRDGQWGHKMIKNMSNRIDHWGDATQAWHAITHPRGRLNKKSDNKNVESVYSGWSFSRTKEWSRHALSDMDRTGNIKREKGANHRRPRAYISRWNVQLCWFHCFGLVCFFFFGCRGCWLLTELKPSVSLAVPSVCSKAANYHSSLGLFKFNLKYSALPRWFRQTHLHKQKLLHFTAAAPT